MSKVSLILSRAVAEPSLYADAQGGIIDLRLLSSEAAGLLAFGGRPKIIDVPRRRHVDSDGATSAAPWSQSAPRNGS
jgi:hypothetical protein